MYIGVPFLLMHPVLCAACMQTSYPAFNYYCHKLRALPKVDMTIGSFPYMKPTLMVCKQSIWPQLLPDQRFLLKKWAGFGWPLGIL